MGSRKKYFNHVVLKNNELLKSDRVSMYDSRNRLERASYGELEDYKNMTTYEFAELQKKMFRENRKKRRKFLIIFISAFVITLGIIIYFLFLYETGAYHPM